MSQGMERLKVNSGDRVWAIFLSLGLAALKHPCGGQLPTFGDFPPMGFWRGVEGLELPDLEGIF